MGSDFIVRPYQEGDEEGIVELLRIVFEGWPHFDLKCNALEHWRWKIIDNPSHGLAVVTVSQNRIVACDHAIIFRVKMGQNIYLTSTGVDVAVHPDFRERGISSAMDELKTELLKKTGMAIYLRIGMNPILIQRNIRRGFPRFPHEMTDLVRISDISLHLRMTHAKNALVKTFGFRVMRFYNRLLSSFGKSVHKEAFDISETGRFDERINTFWDEIKGYYDFILEINEEYLNWRYCDYRCGEYLVKQAQNGNRILGYCVIRINTYQEAYPIGYIVDLLTLPDRLDVAEALVKDAIKYFEGNHVNVIKHLVIKNCPYSRIFHREGFVNVRPGIVPFLLFYGNNKEDYEKIQRGTPDHTHFVYGNFDLI